MGRQTGASQRGNEGEVEEEGGVEDKANEGEEEGKGGEGEGEGGGDGEGEGGEGEGKEADGDGGGERAGYRDDTERHGDGRCTSTYTASTSTYMYLGCS